MFHWMSLNAQVSIWASTQECILLCRLAQLSGVMAFFNKWLDERCHKNAYPSVEHPKDMLLKGCRTWSIMKIINALLKLKIAKRVH